MNIQDNYKLFDHSACKKILSEFQNLDDNITIGEIKKHIQCKIEFFEKQEAEMEKALAIKLVGKCLEIYYGENKIVYLKIEKITIIKENGVIDALMHGEKILFNEGISIVWDNLDRNDKYSKYFDGHRVREIPDKLFDITKETHLDNIHRLIAKLNP